MHDQQCTPIAIWGPDFNFETNRLFRRIRTETEGVAWPSCPHWGRSPTPQPRGLDLAQKPNTLTVGGIPRRRIWESITRCSFHTE